MSSTDGPTSDASPADAPPAFRTPGQIRVHAFRQILIWPVLLEEGWGESAAEPAGRARQLSSWAESFQEHGWEERPMLVPGAAPPPAGVTTPEACDPTYEEIVYFHPYIRDLLYGDGHESVDDRVVRRLVRRDLSRTDVYLHESGSQARYTFRTPRVELYLCKPLTALLVVELAWDPMLAPDAPGTTVDDRSPPLAGASQLTLADVLLLQRRLRQAYPPYFDRDHDTAGGCPAHVVLTGVAPDGKTPRRIASDFQRHRTHWARQTQIGAEPPVAEHWRQLLAPIEPFRKRGETRRGFRQIVDDRIPSMVYLAVDDPRSIAPGDFDRLTWCEDGGSNPTPYSEQFLADDRRRYQYDRFWRDKADHDRPGSLEFTTRYLCSGFNFVAVGRAGNGFFDNLVLDHWRRHYLRLGMLAHFQRAALLKFADDMGEAVKLLKGLAPQQELDSPAFRDRVQSLQMTYLKFLARAWFSEASSQLQGQELFAWWSKLLGTPGLFAEVDTINDEIHSVLNTRYSQRLDEHGLLISILAIVVSLAALVVSIIALG